MERHVGSDKEGGNEPYIYRVPAVQQLVYWLRRLLSGLQAPNYTIHIVHLLSYGCHTSLRKARIAARTLAITPTHSHLTLLMRESVRQPWKCSVQKGSFCAFMRMTCSFTMHLEPIGE